MSSNIRKIAGMNSALDKFRQLDMNPFSTQQIKSLDRYRLTKIERLNAKLTEKFKPTYADSPANLVNRFVGHRDEPSSFYRKLVEIDSEVHFNRTSLP